MAYGTGYDPNSPVAPRGATAFGVKPMTESPINAARAWARAGEVGSYDNAKRASATSVDPTQSRSLGGANAAMGSIRGTRATARPSITTLGSVGAAPEEADVRGDAGPSRLTSGVAPNFYAPRPYYDQTYGTTGTVASNLIKLLNFGGREKEAPKDDPKGPPELGPGPDRPKIGTGGGPSPVPYRGGSPDIYNPPVDGEIVDEIGTTYPALGQEIIDVESWETAGELGRARTPGMDRRAQRAIGTGNKALGAGDPDAGPNPSLGPPEGFAMGDPTPTPADPFGRSQGTSVPSRFGGRGSYGFRPMGEVNSAQNAPEQADVEAAADAYEFGNAYFGESNNPVGRKGSNRRSAMGEFNARMTEDQGQIPGMDWGDIDRM